MSVTLPNGSHRTIPLSGDRLSLGRSSSNDLSYPEDSGLSRHHVALEKVGDEWYVRDLGSKNGTLLNDERLAEPAPLKPGDRISASRVSIVFDGSEPAAGEATVIFSLADTTEKLPTHTVTLGDLLPKTAGEGLEPKAYPPKQWTDPVTALVRAGRELVARKPISVLFHDILDLCLEAVGATRGVMLVLEDKDDPELTVAASRGGEFRISTAIRDRVLNERSSLLIGDVMSDEALRLRQSIVRQGVHSLMAAPLQTDERVMGIIYVDSPVLWRQFTADDLNLLTIMANVAALRIERERLAAADEARRVLESELERAAEIQRQLLPREAPDVPGLDLAGYNRPCLTVGGDYYDFMQRPDGRVVVALGDVAGKGMSAALLMVNLQVRVQMLAEHPATPAAMVTQLNRAMAGSCPANRFVTFVLCQIDPFNWQLAYCNAGHNPPFMISSDGRIRKLDGGGLVLGVFPGIAYEERIEDFQPGDMVALYSDGVTEAVNPDGEEFGEDRFLEILLRNRHRSAGEVMEAINRSLDDFCGPAASVDDITLVIARRTGGA
ncbi:MAG: SpoIIE family protein phosphatase [Bryobacteraceae bacterium]|nr:SpoIIE family protein phosphatase [Bryobacteraceae bacterium]